MNNQETLSTSLLEEQATAADTTTTVDEAQPLPDHLAALPGEPWAVWRWAGLRGAGFPIWQVLSLSAPECAVAAENLMQAEDLSERFRKEAQTALERDLYLLRHDPQPGDADKRVPLEKALRALKKGNPPPQPLGEWFDKEHLLDAFREAHARLAPALSEFRKTYEANIDRISEALYGIAQDERFREAIIWQNRHALHGSIGALLRMPPRAGARGSERRRREESVASYVQRYCTKNDTIGFFGPVGWVKFVPEGEAMTARPGPELLSKRTVYFEGWCVDALAQALGKEKGVQMWVAPRRVPMVHIEGLTAFIPPKVVVQMSEREARLLHECDGVRTAKEIAQHLCAGAGDGFESEDAVYGLLKVLCNKGLVAWSLEVPIEMYPERTLRRQLSRIGDEEMRGRMLAALDDLEAARDRIAAAAGDSGKLDEAIRGLEETFTRLTGESATRSAGKLYAARTLAYEDCCRDLELSVGPDVLKELAAPLSLLLTSARWLVYQGAAVYRKEFEKIYTGLTRRSGSSSIPFIDFWFHLHNTKVSTRSPLDSIMPVFQRRWMDILRIPPGERRLSYKSEELRARVLEAFSTPKPAWRGARYHSPDLMIAARDVEAIKRGDYRLVLGELHVGVNTLGYPAFLSQHPAPEQIFEAYERDMPEPGLLPIISKYHAPERTARVFTELISKQDYCLDLAPDSSIVPKTRVLSVGDLVIERRADGELAVCTRDGRLKFDLMEVFGLGISDLVCDCFKILFTGAHTPRIEIDRLIIRRESWSFNPTDLTFAFEDDEVKRYVAARRWARAHGIPGLVFAKVPVEDKPFYVDLDSPVFIDIFSKTVRKTLEAFPEGSSIGLTEMVPSPEEAWLHDAEGQHYTSELRIVAVDLGR